MKFANLSILKALIDRIEQIKQLGDTYHVRSLFAFGSVVSDKLKRGSDNDLIVDFDSKDSLDYSDNYFASIFQLENILKRRSIVVKHLPKLEEEITNF